MSQFVHLHLHTQYSLLDGVNKIPAVLEQAAALGQPAIAMTDHGNMHGAIEFYLAAHKAGIKPIIGCELYVTPGSRMERKTRAQGGAGTNHLTVMAMNYTGYQNLCRLVTLAYREGFFYKPRVDHELLERYNEGLIVLSGCLASEVGRFSQNDQIEEARKRVEFYSSVFKDRYYLEVQPHQIDEQMKLNLACEELARDKGIPLVATTDCHYASEDDHYAQEVLMCISMGRQITDPNRIRHVGVKLHLKDVAEMQNEFRGWSKTSEAISNSVEIAERCNLEFDFSTYYMPNYELENKKQTLIEAMSQKARHGLERRFAFIEQNEGIKLDREVYNARLEEEIELIERMGFAGYFLVVADFIIWAKENGVPVGPGRGSVAGSLVAYALRITEVDPIRHKLLFERFLNPDRISLPDIDVDFCIHGRDDVIKYVVDKYGKEKVAQIATFGTLKAKAAIKDVGRALGISYAETDRVAQLVPAPRQGFDFKLKEALEMEPRLKEYAQGEGQELVTLAMKLEGLTRHASTHAAGVVIGDKPLIDMLPMMVDKEGNEVTQFSMKYVEKIGLVKFDFLGLKTLTVIHTALKLIKQSRGVEIDLEALTLDDSKTYDLLVSGNTVGVFQLESTGITEMTMRLKPSCFNDVVAILALYRPGPLDAGMVDNYINRKHSREEVTVLHPLMSECLSDTYGIILYQEQIMQLARELAGYSLGEADLLRRAMGKKIPAEMAKQRVRFLQGTTEKGISEKVAHEIFDQMETFARYGFNRSHSAAYGMVSYQTAYLKAHYPVEFMAALMSHEMDDSDKVLKNLNECRKQGVQVLGPDVNSSYSGFSVEGGKIRFGLSALKGVGEKAVDVLVREREKDGDFKDLEDFATRVDLKAVNRRVFEALIKSGAFDCSGETRQDMMVKHEEVMRAGQTIQKELASNQMSLIFGGSGEKPSIPKRAGTGEEWPVNQKLSFERESLGVYISGHPLAKYRRALKRMGVISTSAMRSAENSSNVRLGGVVTALKLKNTKKGDRYATFVLEDWLGTVETIVWPDVYRQVAHLLTSDLPVVVAGRADVTDERCNLIVDKVESLIELRDKSATQGVLLLKAEDQIEQHKDDLVRIFKHHTGTCPIKLRLRLGDSEVAMVLKDEGKAPVCVLPSEDLCDEVERLFGRPVLSFI